MLRIFEHLTDYGRRPETASGGGWANFATNGYPSIVPWYCISAEFIGAICLIPGIYTRWVCLYTLPLIAGAAQFWAVRKGFFFTAGGCELPIVWSSMLA